MAQWYVKGLSKLTGVSVQTLHHYDRIGLLTPSIKLANGYRLYSEKDLLKLQQIIALKFFGFELSKIKMLLADTVDVFQHFANQATVLEEKAKNFNEASKALKNIIAECDLNKSVSWETIIKIIEVYQMTQKLEHSWVKEIFTPEKLKQYANFETEMKANSTPEQKAAFEKNWSDLVEEIRNHLESDPKSEIGIIIGGKCMHLING